MLFSCFMVWGLSGNDVNLEMRILRIQYFEQSEAFNVLNERSNNVLTSYLGCGFKNKILFHVTQHQIVPPHPTIHLTQNYLQDTIKKGMQ